MRTLAAIALLVPAFALGQEAAPQLQEDPRAARFSDVERGFFIGLETGYLGLRKTPTENREKFQLAGASGGSASGLLVGVVAGVDIGRRISVGLYAQGASQSASANYGSFSLLSGGVDLKLAFWSWRDRNDWERLFFFLHGRVGYSKTYPEGLFGTGEVISAGGLGVEYFTKLRHFSLGLVADTLVLQQRSWSPAGFAVYPTVRYTF